jgi:hypothetical protein
MEVALVVATGLSAVRRQAQVIASATWKTCGC